MSLLEVRLDGRRVAVLDGSAGAGIASLSYDADVVETSRGLPLLSVRLPVRAAHYPAVEVRAWLDGLLPEGGVRAALAARRRLDEDDLFGLLRHYGRDCAGAVSLVDPDDEPGDLVPAVRWLSDDDLHAAVRALPQAPFGVGVSPKVRISLGGVQGKLAVVWDGARVGLPEGLAASTHILKPPPLLADGSERYPGIVTAEAMCLRVCHHIGLDVPDVVIVPLATGDALLVTRYDRRRTPDGVTRLHQEDFAQALGITSLLKYQEGGRDFPSLTQLVDVLRREGAADVSTLAEVTDRVALHGLLTNCDAHAKNWSFLLADGRVRLAPVYDVVPTTLWPHLDTTLAMPVGAASQLEDVTADDLREQARRWGYGERAVNRRLARIEEEIDPALTAAAADVMAMGGDPRVIERIRGIVSRRVAEFF